MEQLRARMQKKISSKGLQNDSAVSLVEQSRRRLEKLFSECQNNDNESFISTQEVTKYNNKFQDLEYLNQARTKINELTLANQRLNMKLLESDKHILTIKQRLDEERGKLLTQESKLTEKYLKQKQEMKSQFQLKHSKNLKYIDELLQQKQQFNKQTEIFINQKRKLQKLLNEQKEKTKIQVKSKLQAFEISQKQKRIKWEQNKYREIKQNTIKGMQPQLNLIITRSKNQIKLIQEKFIKQKQQYRNDIYNQYERKIIQLKQQTFKEYQIEKQKLRIEYSTKIKEQYNELEKQFTSDREKMRSIYKVQIEEQKNRRKSQQQDFIRKRREIDFEHMNEIKRIRDDYQERIRYIQNNRDAHLVTEKERLETKFKDLLEAEIEKVKKQEKQKVKNAYIKLQEKFQNQKEQYIKSVAEMNEELERDLQIKFQNKRKDERKLFDEQIRKYKRDCNVLQQKLQRQNKTSGSVAKQKDEFQTKYMQIKIKYDQLFQTDKQNKLKIKALQKQLDTLNCKVEIEIQQKLNVQKSKKQKQLDGLRKIIQKQQQDRILLGRSNDNKVRQCQKKWSQQMLELQKRARKAIDKKDSQIQNLKRQIRKKEQTAKEYQGMLQKQRQQLMASLYK